MSKNNLFLIILILPILALIVFAFNIAPLDWILLALITAIAAYMKWKE